MGHEVNIAKKTCGFYKDSVSEQALTLDELLMDCILVNREVVL